MFHPTLRLIAFEGGKGSGNFGHAGRKGRLGGSTTVGSGGTLRAAAPDIPGDALDGLIPKINAIANMSGKNVNFEYLCNGLTDDQKINIKNFVVTELSKESGVGEETVNRILKQWAITSNDHSFAALHMQKMIAEEFGVELSPYQQELYNKTKKVRDRVLALVGGDMAQARDISDYNFSIIKDTEGTHVKLKGSGAVIEFKEWSGMTQDVEKEFSEASFIGCLEHASDKDTKKVLRAMHNKTQKVLKEAGIDYVTCYRGITEQNKFEIGTRARHRGNACESWAASGDDSNVDISRKIANAFGVYTLKTTFPRERILSTFITGMGCASEAEFVVLGGKSDEVNVLQGGFW